MIEEKTHSFLAKLLASPEDFRHHVELSVLYFHSIVKLLTPCSLQGRLIMSLTYGYDLKDEDDMIAAPTQTIEILSRVVLPGAALVNYIPFCTFFRVTQRMYTHGSPQYDTFLRGSHGLATNRWRK
jgi:hypothetical protein